MDDTLSCHHKLMTWVTPVDFPLTRCQAGGCRYLVMPWMPRLSEGFFRFIVREPEMMLFIINKNKWLWLHVSCCFPLYCWNDDSLHVRRLKTPSGDKWWHYKVLQIPVTPCNYFYWKTIKEEVPQKYRPRFLVKNHNRTINFTWLVFWHYLKSFQAHLAIQGKVDEIVVTLD